MEPLVPKSHVAVLLLLLSIKIWQSEINSIVKSLQKITTNVGGNKNVRSFVPFVRLFVFFETLNGHLPLEESSDRRETMAKRVSEDLQLFIFQRRKCFWYFFLQKL